MSKIPATAGKQITEAELRAFTKCSEFYNFGGSVPGEFRLHLLAKTTERMLGRSIENNEPYWIKFHSSVASKVAAKLNQKAQLIDGVVEREIIRNGIDVGQVFNTLSPAIYKIVSGPVEIPYKINKTQIKLQVSGVFRSMKNETLHVLTFSPFVNEQSAANDAVNQIKAMSLQHLVRERGVRPQIRLHTFAVNDTSETHYSTLTSIEISDDQKKKINSLVMLMESGYHFPLVPCPYQCPYKSICRPK